jgi:RNA polymerase sigma factor (sigma-70 family)
VAPLLSTTLLRAQTDRRLVQLVQAGHEPAFTTIVERYRAQLHRYCLRILPEARCDDALQQAFLQAWRALHDGRPVRQLRPWLYAIVHNAAVSQLRQGVFDYSELLDTVQGADDPEADVERRAIMRQTLAAVAALPERQRAALLAVVLEGRPQAQVALEMGLTENGLRQLLFRARTTLRSAATALTPTPLLVWAMRAGTESLGRAGEVAAGSAAVAGGAHVLQTGTALLVAGSLALGGTAALEAPAVERHATHEKPLASVRAGAEAAPVALPNRSARRAGARHLRPASGAVATRRAPAARHLVIFVDEPSELAPARRTPAPSAPAPAAAPTEAAETAAPAPEPSPTSAPAAPPPVAQSSTAAPAPDPALGTEHGEDGPGSGDGGGDPAPAAGRVDNSGPGNMSDDLQQQQPQQQVDNSGPGSSGGDGGGSGSGDGSSDSGHGPG